MTTPILGAKDLTQGQGLPETDVNENTRRLEQGARWFGFTDALATPPGAPADGDTYLVLPSATGAWAGHDNEIAFFMNTAWEFIVPGEGMAGYFADTDTAVAFDGTAWNAIGGGGAGGALDDLSDVTLSSPTSGQVLKYNGSAWVNGADATGGGSGGNGEAAWTTPTLSGNFPTTRAGAGSVADFSNGVRLAGPGTTTNSNSLIYAMQSISAGASGWRATTRLRRHFPLHQWAMTGILLRNSSDGKSRSYAIGYDAAIPGVNRNTWTNDTTWASVTNLLNSWFELNLWMRIHDDLTNHKFSISLDGDAWLEVYSEARTTHVTPDQVGFFLNPNVGTGSGSQLQNRTVTLDCLSWEFESLP